MSFLIITNGVGRAPHVETLDDIADVRSRLEIESNADDLLIVEGRIVPYQRQSFLYVEDQVQEIPAPKPEGVKGNEPQQSPFVYRPPTSYSEDIGDVAGDVGGPDESAPSELPRDGSESRGDGDGS